MTFRAALLLVILGFCSLSCENPSSQDFEIKLQGDNYYLLNTSGMSCKQQYEDPTGDNDLGAVTTVVSKPKIRWEGQNPLRLEYIQISLTGAGLSSKKYVQTYSGNDLALLWTGGVGVIELSPAASDQAPTSTCTWGLGSIPISNKEVSWSGQGQIRIYGTTVEGEDRVPKISTQYFSWEFRGTGQ